MLVGKKNAWNYVMKAWGSLVDCLCESYFDEYLKKFEMACFPWPMFVDYVCQTWVIPYKEKFVKAWTNKVMHLGNTTTNRVESVHWSLKRLLRNNIDDICNVWEPMNNMMTLQHPKLKHLLRQVRTSLGMCLKLPCTKNYLALVSRYTLNEIVVEYECVTYANKNLSHCGCAMRTTHGLPCTCEKSKYVGGSIPLETIHIFRVGSVFQIKGYVRLR
ncbi:hypothetical protein GmHk_13G036966 [Glycine max]|nr:hypothetical protein GmHk_13G036966 [Glycine max]